MKRMTALLIAAVLFGTSAFSHAAPKTVRLDVPGMTCALCPITVRKALTKVDGVSKVEVSYERREAVVTFDDTITGVEALLDATRNAGYPSTLAKEPD